MFNVNLLWGRDLSEEIIQGKITILEDELQKGWDVNAPLPRYFHIGVWKYPIMLAIQNNNMESTKFLIKHGAKLSIENENALLYAIQYAESDLVELIAIKMNKRQGKILSFAYSTLCKYKKYHLISILDQSGISINPYGLGALAIAIMEKDFETIDLLLQHGINLNQNYKDQGNPKGNTPLGKAVLSSDLEMITYLMEHGSDPSIPNMSGERPFHLAVLMNKFDLVKLLKQYEPAMLDIVNEMLPTSYLEFVKQGKLEIKDSFVGKIRFLPLEEIFQYWIGRREFLTIAYQVADYPDLILLWDDRKKSVLYYDSEHQIMGDFKASFSEFIKNIDTYMKNIFTDVYVVRRY